MWLKADWKGDFLKSKASQLICLGSSFPYGQTNEDIQLYFITYLEQCAEVYKYSIQNEINMFDLAMNDYQIIKLTKQN